MVSSGALGFVKERIRQLRIAVVGDVMLDRYFFGEVTRISPEAPVPVNKIKKLHQFWEAQAMWPQISAV